MNRRLLTFLVFAVFVAGGCSFLVYKIATARLVGARKSSTVRIIAAASDLKLGTVLTAANLTTTEVAGALPKGAILKPETAIGRGVISDLYQGEPILEERLAPLGSGGGLAASIKQGMRACAVKVDEVVGVSGFVTPGMRVDVLISGDPPGERNSKDGTEVVTLLQNIQVLSAGTDIEKDAEGKPQQTHVVNLLVTPEEAEVLSLASNHTQIQLVLRNPLDTKVALVPGSAMANLFAGFAGNGRRSPGPVGLFRKPAPRFVSIEVINGSQRTEKKFAISEGTE
jgi:pilus assembly protein CpaB